MRERRPQWNKRHARFVELVNAGMYTEPEAFAIITKIGTGKALSPEERQIEREVVEHFGA
ncbi:MAG: hypothetical protein V2I24_09435 [Halieaceae bacterium]|jgi:hypothetical protein|nr:hypothetical protein [Halieaceae bacterium]